jgi:hypothetical protein
MRRRKKRNKRSLHSAFRPFGTERSGRDDNGCEDGCHAIKPRYGMPKVKKGAGGYRETEAAVHLKRSGWTELDLCRLKKQGLSSNNF